MRGSSARVRRVHDLGLLVEDGDDPVERGGRGEERVVELRELLHRVEEVREVEREGEQRPDREAPVDDERAAEAEHDRRRDRREHVDGGEVEAVQDDRLVVRLAVALVDAAEGRLARRLARERLHDAHARDVLGERRRDEPEALAHAPVRAVRADSGTTRSPRPSAAGRAASRARGASRGGRGRPRCPRAGACSGRGSRGRPSRAGRAPRRRS